MVHHEWPTLQGLHALFPKDGKNAVELTPSDLERLDPDEFLNDTIIDFYMKYVSMDLLCDFWLASTFS